MRRPRAPRALAGLLRATALAGFSAAGLGLTGLALALAQAPPPPPGLADAPPSTTVNIPELPAAVGTPPTGRRQASAPIQRDQPFYYQADQAEYNRETGIAILTGHVEFWQNDRILLADKVTYDRGADVAAASGHVVLLEPDGQTVFTEYAELTGGMKDGVMSGMRSLLAEGGRLVANGGRRTGGLINELTRAVYSTCALCADDPDRAPLWQIRAREAVQDRENKRIEYRDAVVDFFGVPVAWFPFLTHPDPTERRASGILPPNIGSTKALGFFTSVPYFWVIDAQSDATITPVLATRNGPAAELQYRRRFNDGTLTIDGSLANERGDFGGHVFAKGQFAIDETWRWGFDLNRATSSTYMRDFRVQGWSDILTSRVYVEGFGEGAYARLDARAYQGLSSTIVAQKLPAVLPRAEYSLIGPQDALGGRSTVDFDAFNILRDQGTLTRRVHAGLQWDRPAIGPVGDVWKFTARVDAAAYDANKLDQQPNFSPYSDATTAQALPTVAVELRWPLTRDAGDGGSQVIEPIVQLAASPRASSYQATRIPNEDSLDTDFTDANLFSLNRHSGVDRLEGGMRANVALHGVWYLRNGTILDAQVGEAFRLRNDRSFAAGSGLENTASDIVSHLSVTPTAWLDVTSRQRFDRKSARLRFVDMLATVGTDALRVSGGYIYSATTPYALYDTSPPPSSVQLARNEVTLSASTHLGPWRLRGFGRRDMRVNKMTTLGAGASYEDECFIFDVSLYRRYTSINNDHGASTILFQITLKTVGELGFHAL
jgi:LPS-assembly protein